MGSVDSIIPDVYMQQWLNVRDWIVHIKPLYCVSLEMSPILFTILNLYKTHFVARNMNGQIHAILSIATGLCMFIDRFVNANPYHLYGLFMWCSFVACLMSTNLVFTIVTVSVLIGIMQPLNACLDLLFFACILIKCHDAPFFESPRLNIASFICVQILIAYVRWHVDAYGPSLEIGHALAFICLVTVVYFAWPQDQDFVMKLHMVFVMYFPVLELVLNLAFFRDEKLSYAYPNNIIMF